MEVVIVYKGALAYYEIRQLRADVYNAYLKRYGGYEKAPVDVTLVRSIRHWTGSVDDEGLLRELGQAIDRHRFIDPLFPQRGEDRTIIDNLV